MKIFDWKKAAEIIRWLKDNGYQNIRATAGIVEPDELVTDKDEDDFECIYHNDDIDFDYLHNLYSETGTPVICLFYDSDKPPINSLMWEYYHVRPCYTEYEDIRWPEEAIDILVRKEEDNNDNIQI